MRDKRRRNDIVLKQTGAQLFTRRVKAWVTGDSKQATNEFDTFDIVRAPTRYRLQSPALQCQGRERKDNLSRERRRPGHGISVVHAVAQTNSGAEHGTSLGWLAGKHGRGLSPGTADPGGAQFVSVLPGVSQ